MNLKSSLVAAALLTSAVASQARDVYWSIGIQAPLHPNVSIGTVFSNAPAYRVYEPAPVVYAAPVYAAPVYAPAPIYIRPAPVYYDVPQPVYRPARVIYQPVYVKPGHKWKHGHGKRHGGSDDADREDRWDD